MPFKDQQQELKGMYWTCAALILASIAAIAFISLVETGVAGYAVRDVSDSSEQAKNASRLQAIHQWDPDQALEALMEAEDAVDALGRLNTSTYFFKDSLLQAKRYYVGKGPVSLPSDTEGDLAKIGFLRELNQTFLDTPEFELVDKNVSQVVRLTKKIMLKKQEVLDLYDAILLTEKREQQLRGKGVNTSLSKSLLTQTVIEFNAERFASANTLLAEAGHELAQEEKEFEQANSLTSLKTGFFGMYGVAILIGFAILVIVAIPLAKVISGRAGKANKEEMEKDLRVLEEIMKKTKNDYTGTSQNARATSVSTKQHKGFGRKI